MAITPTVVADGRAARGVMAIWPEVAFPWKAPPGPEIEIPYTPGPELPLEPATPALRPVPPVDVPNTPELEEEDPKRP